MSDLTPKQINAAEAGAQPGAQKNGVGEVILNRLAENHLQHLAKNSQFREVTALELKQEGLDRSFTGKVLYSAESKAYLNLKDLDHDGKYDYVDVAFDRGNAYSINRDFTTVKALQHIMPHSGIPSGKGR
jgi:hypothetical protein